MPPKKKTPKPAPTTAAPVASYKHDATRKRIPTQEESVKLSRREKQAVKKTYAYDPSLDPQLIWSGKREAGAEFDVPTVPIYVQEHVAPEALIARLKSGATDDRQMLLFGETAEDQFQKAVEFYKHEDNWQNRMILGDSLLVMNSLLEKEGMRGKVQTIYMDPPYGIKFGSNWQVSTRNRDVKNNKVEDFIRQPEQVKAFRDTWELGIHSYLSYLRDRLIIARELLNESGSCFVQISDENVHHVREVMDEVFGGGNFISHIVYRTSAPLGSKFVPGIFDHIIWYAKNIEQMKFRRLFSPKTVQDDTYYDTVESPYGEFRKITKEEQRGENDIPIGHKVFANITLVAAGPNPNCVFPIEFHGKKWNPTSGRGWKTNQEGISRVRAANRLYATANVLRYKFFLDDFPLKELTNLWTDFAGASDKTYVVQTNTDVIQRCMLMTTDPGDLVLDPTCGSGTTAYAAEQWGRRWITMDTSRVALQLARTRLMTAKYPFYRLKDERSISAGFEHESAPHITLKSIANNEEIEVIYEKLGYEIDEVLLKINKLSHNNWRDWEVPYKLDGHSPEIRKLIEEYWRLCKARQSEIDISIVKNAVADTEILYDKPLENKKIVRVAGPFTVESLSPHRVSDEQEMVSTERFVNIIIENLLKSGVQTGEKGARLEFVNLDVLPSGPEVQAVGEYKTKDGLKKAAVAIGPEFGSVDDDFIRDAVTVAKRFSTLLVVAATSFDASAHSVTSMSFRGSETTEKSDSTGKDFSPPSAVRNDMDKDRNDNFEIMKVKINPDLSMGDLLKKTGSGNLFLAFGEPEIKVQRVERDGIPLLQVEILGVDVYDPVKSELRSSGSGNLEHDIAAWFIDTNYSGEAFFVTHAYFLGDKPFEKLKKALKADINEELWEELYSTTSRPFPKPKTGKIAVKVINHFGDEVMKVMEVG